MKKAISILLVILVSISLLASCGRSQNTAASPGGTSSGGAMPPAEKPMASESKYELGYDGGFAMNDAAASPSYAPMPEAGEVSYDVSASITNTSRPTAPNAPQGGDGLAEKIIYSIYANIETVDFDATIDAVYGLLAKYGAFIENSSIDGRNYTQEYYGWQTYRSARFSLRVPVAVLNEAKAGLDELGNVTSLSSDAQNITAQFFDTESRLSTYRTEESRLLEMLGKADTVADMITIEARLSDVRYNIESLTSTLKNWQNQVDYSTMTLSISEVEKLSEVTPIQRSYWKQISDGFVSTLKAIGGFFKDLFKWIITASPVLVLVAIIVVAILLIAHKKLRRLRKNKKSDEREDS